MDGGAQAHYIVSRLASIGVLIAGLLLGIYFATSVSDGRYLTPLLFMAPIFGFAIGIAMGERAWILIPVAFSAKALPALPFAGRTFEIAEVACMGVFGLFVARICFGRQALVLYRLSHTFVYLYVAWVMVLFSQSGVGFAVLGSGVGGGRFYLKIIFALLAFIVLANQKITEKEARWVIIAMLAGAFVDTGYSIFNSVFFTYRPAFEAGGGDEYSWHQVLSGAPFLVIVWIFSRYRMDEVFSARRLPWIAPLGLLAVALALYSGKRAGFAMLALIPVLASMARRQWVYFISFGLLGATVLSILVLGHGKLFELPFTVQRTLANLPGDWDQKVISQTRGQFRQELRAIAIEDIKKSPWVGNGGIAVDFAEMERYIQYAEDPTKFEAAGHAASSNWHNTWLGIAADFGIPGSAFYLGFMLSFLYIGYRLIRRFPHGSHRCTLAYMLFFFLVTSFLRTWTSGHSALTPYGIFWMAGIMAALYYSRESSAPATAEEPILKSDG